MAKKTARPARAGKKTKSKRSFAGWTAADEQKLRKLAGKLSTPKIAKALNRSVAAVTFKAFALRLSLRLPSSNRGRRLKVSKR
ncbi:MAG: hypothetical protein FGM62_09720 [Methylobacterium sp.]|jgi:hypothetical protein|nr:hypothetical protein [Methylobacterium sp.]